MNLAEIAALKAPLLTLGNLSTGESIDAMFNPSELNLALTVNYGRKVIPGSSHTLLQYSHTENQIINLSLYYSVQRPADFAKRDEAEKFLLAACYPQRSLGSVLQGSPPRVLLVWPNHISLECRITTLNTAIRRWNATGDPVVEEFTITLEEARNVRLFSSEVRESGYLRSGRSPEEQS